MHSQIPAVADDLTPEWFSRVLDTAVQSVALERLGGLSSVVWRARLGYRSREAAQASVIVKLALERPEGQVAEGFDREVRFYRDLAPQMTVAVPRLLWSDADPATGDFVLVLEDFPGHLARADDAFATDEVVRLLLTEVARVHAAWWGRPELEELSFLRTLPDFIQRVEALLGEGVPLFLERFEGRLGADERALVEALPARFRVAAERLGAAPKTLVHHDLSLRNVLFGQGENEPRLVLIDWQLAQRNAGVRDVSYLIGACLAPEPRSRHEMGLLRHYLACLE
ncbi:MAG: phosphotransferase, partial [Gemmatimonadales bacterium]